MRQSTRDTIADLRRQLKLAKAQLRRQRIHHRIVRRDLRHWYQSHVEQFRRRVEHGSIKGKNGPIFNRYIEAARREREALSEKRVLYVKTIQYWRDAALSEGVVDTNSAPLSIADILADLATNP